MMILGSRSVLTLVTVLTTSVAIAQEPPSQFERVKGLEPYIGFWQGEFQPPGGPEGTLSGFCRWTSNKSYAQFQWTFQPNEGERMHAVTIIMGWNGKDKQLNSWGFFPEGQTSGPVTIDNGNLSVSGHGTSFDGQAISSDATYEISGDKLTVTVKNVKHGDDERPGYSFTVQKRERPQRRR